MRARLIAALALGLFAWSTLVDAQQHANVPQLAILSDETPAVAAKVFAEIAPERPDAIIVHDTGDLVIGHPIAQLDSDDAAALDRKIEAAQKLFADRGAWLKTRELTIGSAVFRRAEVRRTWFVGDSPLEQRGFELVIPPRPARGATTSESAHALSAPSMSTGG